MAENFSAAELVVPGTYIRVRAEGLIGVGGLSTGNIAIAGTATKGSGKTHTLSDFESATLAFGDADALSAGTKNLQRALAIAFDNGAREVYARALDGTPNQDAYTAAFKELVKDDVNILIAPELSTSAALAVLPPILESSETNGKDLIAVIGADGSDVAAIKAQVTANDRLILVAPGIRRFDARQGNGEVVSLSATYSAAAVAGLLATLVPQASPTNKVLSGVTEIVSRFSYGEVVDLIKGGVLVLEDRLGIRVVRGVSTEMASNGPFRQITTRRTTDFAKAGIRQAANPFIGRLNNERVRKALRGAIDGFLTSMVQDEALISYELDVSATRDDEINGRAIVRATIRPTFSIDFIAVTLVLE